MRFVFGIVVGLLFGLGVGWYLSRNCTRLFYYKTTQDLVLYGVEAETTGRLPAGTVMISDINLRREPDLGWWGYVPVQFESMWTAVDLGIVVGEELDSVAQITLLAEASRSDGTGPAAGPGGGGS